MMPFNGSGGASQPGGSIYPAVASTLIESAKANASIADIYAMLASVIVKDGQTVATARVPFASGISTDSVTEKTADTGVTLDGVLLKDGRIDTTQGADIASAATINLETATGNVVDVTGTTAITAVTLSQGHWRLVRFTGALTITNGASLVTGTGADIFTAAGDYVMFVGYAAGVVRVAFHIRGSEFTTGDVKLTFKTSADTGWVLMNDGTIGNGASGGTTRANADTVALFTLLWTNTADAQCAVSTGRGASAAADYAANKTIALPKALGRAIACYGAGSGLTSRALALANGAETKTIGTTNLPASGLSIPSLSVSGTISAKGTAVTGAGDVVLEGDVTDGSSVPYTGTTGTGTTGNMGSGNALDIMNPMQFMNVMMKL